jgi:hypothetical protein
MYRNLFGAAALIVALAPAARGQTASPAAAPAGTAPTWKQIYENSQTVYYVDVSAVHATGVSNVASLQAYKIAQVVGGAQVWSIVSHMQLRCDAGEMLTVDNTLYAAKMGSGPVVEAQPAGDAWHKPQAGSLGGLIWSAACGQP